MDSVLLDALPPLPRLALAYAPAAVKADWLALLALDSRLAGVVHQAREPVLAQIRLAWWRDRLGEGSGRQAKGEPLLSALADWPDGGAMLVPLVDAWEALLDSDNPSLDEDFAAGRVAALGAFAGQIGADAQVAQNLARRWSLAGAALWQKRPFSAGKRIAAPRALRPLLVLERVTARAADKGAAGALTSPAALLTAMRAGLLGR